MTSLEKTLKLKGMDPRYPIIQGGMGIGVSLQPLATAVGKQGCIGTVSSVGLDQLTAKRLGVPRMDFIEATAREIYDTKELGGVAAINIMVALPLFYEKSLEGAIKGEVVMIISGAGLPTMLPTQVKKITGTNDHEINLVPIISSARALKLLIKRYWDKQGYRPDAVVLEGPKAGGHLGWSYKQVEEAGDNFLKEFDLLEKLLDPVLDIANKYPNDYGPIPVIVAGGIEGHEDIEYALKKGAAGVQKGTRFAVTEESGFTDDVKERIVKATKDDIVIADESWGSPCGYPFRYLTTSPLVQARRGKTFCICSGLKGAVGLDNTKRLGTEGYQRACPEGDVLVKDKDDQIKVCPAAGNISYLPIITVGTQADKIDKIVSVEELVKELVHA